MKNCEYKHYEWNVINSSNDELIRELQKLYQSSGRSSEDSELEKMDFICPSTSLDEYCTLTVLPVPMLAAHYACLQIPNIPTDEYIALRNIVYDAAMNVWEFITAKNVATYAIHLDNGQEYADKYWHGKADEFLGWFSRRTIETKKASYGEILSFIIADLVKIRLEKLSQPMILCKCL